MFTLIRFLCALAGALALLYTFSYPDSLLPPNPVAEDIPGTSIYDFKPWFWLAPLLYLEIVCVAGSRRNLVWFGSLLTVFIGGLLAWPVLEAWRPELVKPMLPFEDGKLSLGLLHLFYVLLVSAIFRLVFLNYLFQRSAIDENDSSSLDAGVLDPANARTVREIAADPIVVKPHFLFGEADHGIVMRFQALVARLMKLARLRRALLLAAAALGILWFFLYPQPDEQQAWERDLAVMFETDASGRQATPRAVHAAYRVLRRISDHNELVKGMTREQLEKMLGVDRLPDAYRSIVRNAHPPRPQSVYEGFTVNRSAFLTVTDGRRIAALYISTDEDDRHINVAEVIDAGWNAVEDERRRYVGNDSIYNF